MSVIPSVSYWVMSPGNLLGDVMNSALNYSVAMQSGGDIISPLQNIARGDHLVSFDSAKSVVTITGRGRKYSYTLRDLLVALRREISHQIARIGREDSPQEEARSRGIDKDTFNLVTLENHGVLDKGSAKKLHGILSGRVSSWHRFTHPSVRRTDEALESPTFATQTRIAGEILASAPTLGALLAVGNTGISLARLPRLITEAYYVLYHMPSIGPNLKVLAATLLPITVALTPPITAIASFGWGIGEAIYSAPEYGISGAVRRGFKDIDTAWDYSGDLGVNAIEEGLLKPLPEGKEPFDVNLIEAGRGFFAGVLGAVATVPILSAMMVYRTPQMTKSMFKRIWNDEDHSNRAFFPLKLAYTLLLAPGAAVLLGISPLGGALIGAVEGTKEGYKDGFGAAASEIKTVLKYIWDATGKLAG